MQMSHRVVVGAPAPAVKLHKYLFLKNILLAMAALLLCVLSAVAQAQVARVIDSKGTTLVERSGQLPRLLGAGEALGERDVINVARDSWAILEFNDQTRITLRPNTVFRLDTYKADAPESMLLGLVKGGFRMVTGLFGKRNPRGVSIQTATATIGIRGTEFDARLCDADCAAEERALPGVTAYAREVVARVVELNGAAAAAVPGSASRLLVAGAALYENDGVATGPGSHAVLVFRDGARVTLRGNSRLAINRFRYLESAPADGSAYLTLYAGQAQVWTGRLAKISPDAFLVRSAMGVIRPHGTGFSVSGCIGSACASVSGNVDSSGASGSASASAGGTSASASGSAGGGGVTASGNVQTGGGGGATGTLNIGPDTDTTQMAKTPTPGGPVPLPVPNVTSPGSVTTAPLPALPSGGSVAPLPSPPGGGSAPPPPPPANKVVDKAKDAGQNAANQAQNAANNAATNTQNAVNTALQGAQDVVNFVSNEVQGKAQVGSTPFGGARPPSPGQVTLQNIVGTALDVLRQAEQKAETKARGMVGDPVVDAVVDGVKRIDPTQSPQDVFKQGQQIVRQETANAGAALNDVRAAATAGANQVSDAAVQQAVNALNTATAPLLAEMTALMTQLRSNPPKTEAQAQQLAASIGALSQAISTAVTQAASAAGAVAQSEPFRSAVGLALAGTLIFEAQVATAATAIPVVGAIISGASTIAFQQTANAALSTPYLRDSLASVGITQAELSSASNAGPSGGAGAMIQAEVASYMATQGSAAAKLLFAEAQALATAAQQRAEQDAARVATNVNRRVAEAKTAAEAKLAEAAIKAGEAAIRGMTMRSYDISGGQIAVNGPPDTVMPPGTLQTIPGEPVVVRDGDRVITTWVETVVGGQPRTAHGGFPTGGTVTRTQVEGPDGVTTTLAFNVIFVDPMITPNAVATPNVGGPLISLGPDKPGTVEVTQRAPDGTVTVSYPGVPGTQSQPARAVASAKQTVEEKAAAAGDKAKQTAGQLSSGLSGALAPSDPSRRVRDAAALVLEFIIQHAASQGIQIFPRGLSRDEMLRLIMESPAFAVVRGQPPSVPIVTICALILGHIVYSLAELGFVSTMDAIALGKSLASDPLARPVTNLALITAQILATIVDSQAELGIAMAARGLDQAAVVRELMRSAAFQAIQNLPPNTPIITINLMILAIITDSLVELGLVGSREAVALAERIRLQSRDIVAQTLTLDGNNTGSTTAGRQDSSGDSGSVTVLDGEVEVVGRGRVRSGEMLASAGGLARVVNLPAMQDIKVDPSMFGGMRTDIDAGLYVWVRDGAVQLAKDGKAVDVPAGNAAVATKDAIQLLDAVPNFLRFDPTPRPLPVGLGVADAFRAGDGALLNMCTIR